MSGRVAGRINLSNGRCQSDMLDRNVVVRLFNPLSAKFGQPKTVCDRFGAKAIIIAWALQQRGRGNRKSLLLLFFRKEGLGFLMLGSAR
jgi:hypothetical protein